jgi:hypothetical protein
MKIFAYALIGGVCIIFLIGLNTIPIMTCGDHVAASLTFLIIVMGACFMVRDSQ